MNFLAPQPVATADIPYGGPRPGALVLGGAHGSLAVVRSLGRRGIPVWFVSADQLISKFSRFVGRRLSWPGADNPGAADYLLELGRRHGLDGWVLLPGGDPEARLVSQHRAKLSQLFRVVTPAWEVMRYAHDKRLTNELAQSLGIDFPWSHYPKNRQDVERLQCQFPVILKPTVREGRNAFTQAKAWRVDDRESLLTRYDQAAALVGESAIVLQEMIPGNGSAQFSYAALWDKGEPVASLVARRARQYPIDFGYTSTFVQTIEHRQVEDSATRFLRSLNYSGLAEIEFKFDKRDGRYKILDVNARTWTWIGLGAKAGVDFPYLQWRLAMGERLPRLRARPGASWIHALRDFIAACQEMRVGSLTPSAYLKSLRAPLEFAAFSADDKMPGLVDLPLVASHVLTRRLPVIARGAWSLRSLRTVNNHARPDGGRIARIEVFDDFAAAEPHWRGLERANAQKTPYQSFDLIDRWQKDVGARGGVMPFLVVGFDGRDEPAFLLPLGRTRKGPLKVAGFLGDKHVNFNFGIWRRDIAAALSADDVGAIVRMIAEHGGADVLALLRQPFVWEGMANPLALLPHQSSPSASIRLTMSAPGSALLDRVLSSAMRARMRTKERRLQRLDGYRYLSARTPADVDRLLDAFFPMKAAHMAAQALPNLFAEPGNEAFLRWCCHHGLESGNPLIEIHALEGGGELLALFAGISDGRRFSGMFNTYTLSDNARQSPGLVLLIDMIAALADRGLQSFDLGVGEAHYKTFFCKEPEPLFDSFLPLSPLGRLAAIGARAGGHAKRQIKQSRALWRLARTFRQKVLGQAPKDA